jgi:hypothetical protein
MPSCNAKEMHAVISKKARLMVKVCISGNLISCSSYSTVICLGEIKLRVMESLGDKSSNIDTGRDFSAAHKRITLTTL